MTRPTVQAAARRIGIDRPVLLADCARLPLATVEALWDGTAAEVSLADLDALCLALRCQPGDLLVHDPSLVLRLSLTERRA